MRRPNRILPALAILVVSACAVVQNDESVAVAKQLSARARVGELTARFELSPVVAARRGAEPPVRRTTFATTTARRASVTLPSTASGPSRVQDEASGLDVRFVIRGATAAPRETADGWALYRGGLAGADLLQRADDEGTEDFVAFDTRPAHETLTYDVDVTHVAGLRLVGGSLELLDAGGVPRVRVARPYVVDRDKRVVEATLSVDGCSFDESAASPIGRQVRSPGANVCGMHVSWTGVRYPIVVDPKWTTTGSIVQGRTSPVAARLTSGNVLVVGGATGPLADVYDAASGTFTRTGAEPGGILTAVALPNGNALTLTDTSAFVYDAGSGLFGGALTPGAVGPAVLLGNGKLLVVGASAAVLFDPSTGAFVPTGSPTVTRPKRGLARLGSGKVLLVGGAGTSAELYDPVAGTFAPTSAMNLARASFELVVLANGKALIAGESTAEIFDPSTAKFTAVGGLVPRRSSLVALASGSALFTGGSEVGDLNAIADVDLFDGARFLPSVPMVNVRRQHSTTLLASGQVLAVGGTASFMNMPLHSAELWSGVSNAVACTTGDTCESGFCVDGVCCDSACAGQCQACDVAGSVGKCVPTIGKPHGNRQVCVNDRSGCGATCDGVSPTGCTFPRGDKVCGGACSGVTETPSTCNGSGQCVVRPPNACEGHFVCADSASCKTRCESNGDCAPGYACTGGGICSPLASCTDEHTSQSAAGTKEDCTPYRCDVAGSGVCFAECRSVDDCVAPAACDPGGQCVSPPDDGSSGCSASGRDDATPRLLIVALALVFAATRVRRRLRSYDVEKS